MSVIIQNPAYKFSGKNKQELRIYDANGSRIECDVFNATINKTCGSIANPFNVYPIETGSITVDYELFESQHIVLRCYNFDTETENEFGEFVVGNVSYSGDSKKTYTLASTTNISRKLPKINVEYFLHKDGLKFDHGSTPVGNLEYVFGLTYEDKDFGYPVIYDDKKGYISYDSTYVDFDSNIRASFGFANYFSEKVYVSPDCIYASGGETQDGFSRIGIDWVGYEYDYLKINTEDIEASEGNLSYDEFQEKAFTSESVIDYFYLDDGNVLKNTGEKPIGNGIIIKIPWAIGKLQTTDGGLEFPEDAYRKDFVRFILEKSYVKNFLENRKTIDLTTRSIKVPFDMDTYNVVGDSSVTVLDYDFYSEYGEVSRNIDVADNFIERYKKYEFPAYQVSVTYDGTFNMTISSGDAWEGNAQEVSASSSTVSITTSNGAVNLDSVYSLLNNLKTQVADMKQGYVTNEDFASKVAELFDVARLNGSVLEDLTIKGSAFEDGTITGSKIQGGTITDAHIKDGSITGANIAGGTITGANIAGGTIDGTHLTNSIFENGKIHGGIIEATELKDIPFASMDDAFISQLQSDMITSKSITSEWSNAVVGLVNQAVITSAMIESVAAGTITSGTLDTTNVLIRSQSGNFQINDNTLQISDDSIVRVQIGKGSDGNYDMTLLDENGNVMFNASGLQENGIKSGIIRNDMVNDNANISASKLDIASLFTVINEDGTHTFNANKIYMDEKGQSLSVAFSSLSSNVDSLQAQVDGTVKYYTDLREEPTLNNYPANEFCTYRKYGDGIDFKGKFGVFSTETYRKYLGAKAYMYDGSKSWTFSMTDNGTFYWRENSGTIEAELVSKVSALEISVDGLTSDVGEVKTSITNQGTTISSMQSSIKQNTSDIALRVTTSTYNSGMATKVNSAEIIASINKSTEASTVKIKADRIQLDGTAVFNSISSQMGAYVKGTDIYKAGTTTIDGGRIDTVSLFARAITATNLSITGGNVNVTQETENTPYISMKSKTSKSWTWYSKVTPKEIELTSEYVTGSYLRGGSKSSYSCDGFVGGWYDYDGNYQQRVSISSTLGIDSVVIKENGVNLSDKYITREELQKKGLL